VSRILADPIAERFRLAGEENRLALIPYITGCYPDPARFPRLLRAVCRYADVVEIGIPYSDPLADGPTIQLASQHALDQGVTTDLILEALARVRPDTEVPFVAMAYWNNIYKMGMETFAAKCAESGVSGAIVPDLPPEEAKEWCAVAEKQGVDTIFLLAPTSTDERIRLVAERSRGFVYCVSLTGVTGARRALPPQLAVFLDRVRSKVSRPIAVGFGISTPEQVRELVNQADGVIIGSALLQRVDPKAPLEDELKSVESFLRSLKEAPHRYELAPQAPADDAAGR